MAKQITLNEAALAVVRRLREHGHQALWAGGCVEEVEIGVYYPRPEERVSHFDKFRDNVRLSLLHTTLVLQSWWHRFPGSNS